MEILNGIKSATNQLDLKKIASEIGNDQERFDLVMQIFFKSPMRLSQRAATVIYFCVASNPKLLNPHFSSIIKMLRKTAPPSWQKRNAVRIWQFVEIPSEFMDDVADLCFQFLEDRKEAIAVRVFSITVLYNLSEKIPEFKSILQILIEDELPFATAGFRSRGKKILEKLRH